MNLTDLEKYFRLIIGEEYLTRTQLQQIQRQTKRKEAQQRRRKREAQQQRQLIGEEFRKLGITEAIFRENGYNRIPDEYIGILSSEEIKHLIDLVKKHYDEEDIVGVVGNLNSLRSRTNTENLKRSLSPEEKQKALKALGKRRMKI
jgi:hypothetical protein